MPGSCVPKVVSDWVFNKPEQILDSSSFVASVNSFFAQSEFFQLPFVLFSD